jgi:hypothetical protein
MSSVRGRWRQLFQHSRHDWWRSTATRLREHQATHSLLSLGAFAAPTIPARG